MCCIVASQWNLLCDLLFNLEVSIVFFHIGHTVTNVCYWKLLRVVQHLVNVNNNAVSKYLLSQSVLGYRDYSVSLYSATRITQSVSSLLQGLLSQSVLCYRDYSVSLYSVTGITQSVCTLLQGLLSQSVLCYRDYSVSLYSVTGITQSVCTLLQGLLSQSVLCYRDY